jgi:hypothetical protein
MMPPHPRDRFGHRLMTDAKYLLRSLEALLEAQDEDERRARETKRANGVGFNKPDAKRFTEIAQNASARGYFTSRELAICRKPSKRGRLPLAKYWRQLPPIPDEPLVIHVPKRPPQSETARVSKHQEAL